MPTRLRFAFAIMTVAALGEGCGSSSPTTPTSTSSSSTATVASVTVVGTAPSVGSESQLTATATLSSGGMQNVTTQATWTTSSAAVATVNAAGVVTGVTVGSAVITATYQTRAGSATLSIERKLCGTSPGTTNRQVPVFASPFPGSFRIANYFDHEYPLLGNDTVSYQLSPCGERLLNRSGGHAGIDYLMPTGTPIFAVADGDVTFAGLEAAHACIALGGQSVSDSAIEIRHGRFGSRYVHLSQIDVRAGQSVVQGQRLGLSGSVGCSTAPHLHFAATRSDQTNRGNGSSAIDPYGWEGSGTDPWAAHPNGAESLWLWLPGRIPGILP
jgi:murein DD-endopeptidase MepM/ murein hydrolase activator NlpD